MDLQLQNNKIAIIGYGELANQFIQLLPIEKLQFYYYDDNQYDIKRTNSFSFNSFFNTIHHYDCYINGIGYKNLLIRKRISELLYTKSLFEFKDIHKSSFIHHSSNIANGVMIYPMCNIDRNVLIDLGSVINNSVIISHDSSIGKACYLSPGVIISGFVSIGDCTFIGAGTTISNGIKIGENSIIGAGTLVTKDVPPNSFVIGNPMKFVNNLKLL